MKDLSVNANFSQTKWNVQAKVHRFTFEYNS